MHMGDNMAISANSSSDRIGNSSEILKIMEIFWKTLCISLGM